MSSYQRFKKLKSATSLQTNCTYDDRSEKDIKIQINSPKSYQKLDKFSSSSKELVFDDEDLTSSQNVGKNLMNIPILSKKHAEAAFLQASNSSEPLQSQRLKKSHKMIENSCDLFIDSMDFRSMNITHDSRHLSIDDHITSCNYIDNAIIGEASNQKQILGRSKGRNKNNQNVIKQQRWMQDSTKIVKQADQQYRAQSSIHAVTPPISSSINSHKREEFDFKPIAHRLRLSSKYDHLPSEMYEDSMNANRNSSRLKLKDYLYMVEKTSKQSRNSKYSPQNNIPKEPTKLSKVKSEEKFINKHKISELDHINDHIMTSPSKKQLVRQKYSVSNGRMFEILKQEINEEILMTERYLAAIHQEIQNKEPIDEPSDDQMLLLYNLRRQMKEQINKKLSDALQSFKSQNKGTYQKY